MKERKNRTLIITALTVALLSTTVAYAVLQTTLNISGSITRRGGSWGQTFSDLKCTTAGSGNSTVNATTTSGTALSFSGNFHSVGDTISCTYTLKNTGSLDARVSSMSFNADVVTGTYSSFEHPGGNETMIDDGHTKCWFTQNGNAILNQEYPVTEAELPFFNLTGNQEIKNLGITCQYYNLDTENYETTFDISLQIDYVQN